MPAKDRPVGKQSGTGAEIRHAVLQARQDQILSAKIIVLIEKFFVEQINDPEANNT